MEKKETQEISIKTINNIWLIHFKEVLTQLFSGGNSFWSAIPYVDNHGVF
jgi:hypothetical protein